MDRTVEANTGAVASSGQRNYIGDRLRHFRERLLLKQPEMAKLLGISVSLYTKLESNCTTTTIRTLARIAKILNTSVEYLNTGEGQEYLEMPPRTAVQDEICGLSDEVLGRIIELALDAEVCAAAKSVAANLGVSPTHALAMVIRTSLLK